MQRRNPAKPNYNTLSEGLRVDTKLYAKEDATKIDEIEVDVKVGEK